MKRALFLIDEGLTLDDLEDYQRDAIASVFAQFVNPMPGTVAYDGRQVVDGITGDNFDPQVMEGLGLYWECVGLWQWDGEGELVNLVPFDGPQFLNYLAPTTVYDEEGNVVDTEPPTLHLPHRWAGWPEEGV